jgi:hypothetical protein
MALHQMFEVKDYAQKLQYNENLNESNEEPRSRFKNNCFT